jgi:hypothetical protein
MLSKKPQSALRLISRRKDETSDDSSSICHQAGAYRRVHRFIMLPPVQLWDRRTRGSENLCSAMEKDFFDSIGRLRTTQHERPRIGASVRSSALSTRAIAATTQPILVVFVSGQKRGVFGVIKRELRARSTIEPVIGHMKTDGHLGRCYLKGREGDAACQRRPYRPLAKISAPSSPG